MPDSVVGLGLAVVDELLVVDEFPSEATRIRYRQRVVSPGGMVATALAQAARLGCPSQLVSALGDDGDGRLLLRELRALGVGTRRVRRGPECPTTRAIVLVRAADGERRFLVPDRRALERRAPDFDLSAIRAGRILLVDGHFPEQALRALRRARESGAISIGDFSDSRPAYHRMLPLVDYPIVSEEFGPSWGVESSRETLRALRDEYGGLPVVTEGRRGALALVDGRVRRIRSPRVRVRDTTGAGDAFHGAFAAGLCRGLEPLAALSLAAYAAARCCTALGGPAGLLRLEDVPARLLTARGNRRI